ncbi:MAG: Fur family transcriptional regulator [Candidatus Poribacteria bacterium]|nr:Fur family transcriptional regulator [Candidatus Poribacteria bacterium]
MEQILRETGQRVTRQRQILLTELRKIGTHPTAKEIYEVVRCHLPKISLGTVYRNLGVLENLGFLRRLECGGISRYDGDLHRHFHLQCVNCNQVYDIDQSLVKNLNMDLLKSQGFKLLDYKLEFYGLCPSCQKTES